jgi:hypothetical protein
MWLQLCRLPTTQVELKLLQRRGGDALAQFEQSK